MVSTAPGAADSALVGLNEFSCIVPIYGVITTSWFTEITPGSEFRHRTCEHEATESLPGTFHKSFFDTRSNRICADDMEELTPKAARINHRYLIRNTLGKMQIK